MSLLRKYCVALLLTAALPGLALAQDGGTITGTIVDAETQQPLLGVQVLVAGTQIGTLTNQQGNFVIPDVPAGPREVRASIIGYSQGSQSVTVTPGQSVNVSFQLSPSVLALEGVVVTATGEVQRKREIGSSVANIEVADVELAPVTSMADLLQGRTAGVTVLPSSGTTGTGSRIRIRGSNSLSLSNAPLLIIDGIRVDDDESSLGFGVGGQEPSRLNDLNPEDIESIEILRGPSASALYGTAASNGVIQITTKRGIAGAARLHAWTEYGQLDRTVEFPTNVTILDAADPRFHCPLVYENSGICTPEAERYTANPLEGSETTPFDTGSRRAAGASVSGGSEVATFYVSGEYQNEVGVYDEQNTLERVNLQANFTGQFSEELNVGANIGYLDNSLQIPQADNALFGIIGMGMFGDSDPGTVEATGGYENDPQFHYDWLTFQDSDRLTGSIRGNYQPVSWLNINALGGLDRIARTDVNRLPRETIYSIFGDVYTHGFIQNYGYNISNYTANASASAVFQLNPDLVSTTTAGTQYSREDTDRVYAFGAGLTSGAETSLAGATSDFEASEFNASDALLGLYAQQQFGWQDRVFVNAAIRGDKSSAFGTDFGWAWYPALSASWVISDETFFPESDLLNSLRLRAAWGQSGLRPGTEDALLYFDPAITNFQAEDVSAFEFSGLGNADLKPETSTEYEVGFEAGLVQNRLGLELTYFNKTSTDALVQIPIAGSTGATETRWENLAEVNNSGVEITFEGEALDRDDFGLSFALSGSFLDNELVDLGKGPTGLDLDPILLPGDDQRHVEGYPLGGYWQLPIVSFDQTDGRVAFGDVELGDDPVFMGSPFPTREFNLNLTGRLFDFVTISTLFDHKGGQELLNTSRAWRETYEENDARAYDATPSEQADQIALLQGGSYAGYIEDASFVKWRELSITFGIPQRFTNRFGADGLSITLAGRNLATWTDYTGVDPEVNYQGQANFVTAEFATLPPNRYLTIRVDADF